MPKTKYTIVEELPRFSMREPPVHPSFDTFVEALRYCAINQLYTRTDPKDVSVLPDIQDTYWAHSVKYARCVSRVSIVSSKGKRWNIRLAPPEESLRYTEIAPNTFLGDLNI